MPSCAEDERTVKLMVSGLRDNPGLYGKLKNVVRNLPAVLFFPENAFEIFSLPERMAELWFQRPGRERTEAREKNLHVSVFGLPPCNHNKALRKETIRVNIEMVFPAAFTEKIENLEDDCPIGKYSVRFE